MNVFLFVIFSVKILIYIVIDAVKFLQDRDKRFFSTTIK